MKAFESSLAGLLVVALALPPVWAQPPAAPGAVSFAQAVGWADESPRLLAAGRALEATRGKTDAEGVLGTTTLTVMPALPGTRGARPALPAQLTLSQFIGPRLGAARQDLDHQERRALDASRRSAQLRYRLGAARAWLDLRVEEQVEAHLRRALAWADETVAIRERHVVELGRASLVTALAERARWRSRLDSQRGVRIDAALRLARTTAYGMPDATELETMHTVGPDPEVDLPAAPRLEALLAQRVDLEVVAARAMREEARARAVSQRAATAPVWQIGTQLERDPDARWTIFASAGVTLSLFGRGDQAHARAQRDTAVSSGDARASELEAALLSVSAYHEYTHTEEQLATMTDDLLPALTNELEQVELLFQRGEATRRAVFEARERLVLAEIDLARLHGANHFARIRLRLLLSPEEKTP